MAVIPEQLERLLDELLQEIQPEQLQALVDAPLSLVDTLDERRRAMLAEQIRGLRWQMVALTTAAAIEGVRDRSAALAGILETPRGRWWLTMELDRIRRLR